MCDSCLENSTQRKSKKLSVGVLITDHKNNLLIGHPTFGKKWDIPKGLQEKNETYLQTAQRELLEEFNLTFFDWQYTELGKFNYTKEKNLFLYEVKLNDLIEDIDFKFLKCNSKFEDKDKLLYYEINAYYAISFNKISEYMYPSMIKVLEKILNF